MQHISLVLWLLGWPLVYTICNYLNVSMRKGLYTLPVRLFGAVLFFVVWVGVAVYLA